MPRISEHFTLEELTKTNSGIPNVLPESLNKNIQRLAETLEGVRETLNCPLKINSAYRCERVNKFVKGSSTSAHMQALAADFVPLTFSLDQAFKLIQESYVNFDQLILEPSWIHIGLAPEGKKSRHNCLIATLQNGKMLYAAVGGLA